MKKFILLSALLFSLIVNGQIKIKIMADKQSKVEFLETDETDKEKNELIINNQFEKNNLTVSLRRTQDPIFTLIFGKNGKVSLEKGDNIFQFNSAGVVRGYPLATQKLSFPFNLIVRNAKGEVLFEKTIEAPSEKGDLTKENIPENSSILNGGELNGLTKIPIYDAFTLLNYKQIKRREFVEILDYYQSEKKIPADSLLNAYTDNEFLKGIIKEALAYYASKSDLSGTGGFGDFISKGVSSIGGLDVTSLADGVAKFMVKRAKEELSITFFEKFKKILKETPDIETVFPQTANLLNGMDEEIYEYEKYIQNLREAFKKDIQEIHRNLPGIVDNHLKFFSEHQHVKAALLSACYTAQQLEDQAHPGDILSNYPTEYLDSIPNKNYKGAIQTIQILSASLRDTSTEENGSYWVKIKKIRDLVNDKLAFKIYLGLILQEAKVKYDSVAFEGTSLVNLLNMVAPEYDKGYNTYNSYRNYILRFGEKIDALNKMIKDYSQENTSDSSVVEKYAKYFRTSVDLIEYCTEICKLPIIKDQGNLKEFPALLKKYFDVAYSCADLVVDINRKNYSAAINHTVHIYNVVTLREEASTGSEFKIARNRLVKYGSFMATVATAKNSDDVEQAIETAALPVGSARIKRVSAFNVSLNGYVGFYAGYEKIKGVDSAFTFNSAGITAPIGIAASKGHSLLFFDTPRECSSSIFVSLIDLGAITSFRFSNDSAQKVPSIQLKDIISPGIFYSHGFGKTPLSLNIGWQMGPLLRKVNLKENKYENKYSRFSISLCVDIPILNFYTKTD